MIFSEYCVSQNYIGTFNAWVLYFATQTLYLFIYIFHSTSIASVWHSVVDITGDGHSWECHYDIMMWWGVEWVLNLILPTQKKSNSSIHLNTVTQHSFCHVPLQQCAILRTYFFDTFHLSSWWIFSIKEVLRFTHNWDASYFKICEKFLNWLRILKTSFGNWLRTAGRNKNLPRACSSGSNSLAGKGGSNIIKMKRRCLL